METYNLSSLKSRDISDIKPKYKRTIIVRNINLAHQVPVVAAIEISIKDPFYKIIKKKLDKLRSYEYDEV